MLLGLSAVLLTGDLFYLGHQLLGDPAFLGERKYDVVDRKLPMAPAIGGDLKIAGADLGRLGHHLAGAGDKDRQPVAD